MVTLQWMVTIGRFKILTTVQTMYVFRIVPRQVYVEWLKRIYGYLSKMLHAAIRIRIRKKESDYLDLPEIKHDCSRSFIGR
jgi:hypothetical protein